MNGISANIYAKIEYKNPFGSIKDRAALRIIEEAENKGYISKNISIVEATSGNMGIALAGICQIKGYNCKIVMPENMSEARKKLIQQYNAELILTPSMLGMQGSISKVQNLITKTNNIYYTNQFNNIASVNAHKIFTAAEINKQLQGNVDVIVAGIGTGATIQGLSEYFKQINSQVEIIGVLPSHLPHKIQGIGAGIDLPLLKENTINKIVYVDDDDALGEKINIYKTDGLFVGISSGAVIAGVKQLLQIKKYTNKNIVLIFADGGERYE